MPASGREWVPTRLGPREFTDEVEINGLHLQVFIAPQAMPTAVRGGRDERGLFVIEFQYPTSNDEGWDLTQEDQSIRLRIGSITHRLMGIEIDIDQIGADQIGLELRVAEAIQAQHAEGGPERMHLKAAEAAMRNTGAQVLSQA